MENKKKIFNFFDIVIIAIVIVLAALFLLWKSGMLNRGVQVDNAKSAAVQYTIKLDKLDSDTVSKMKAGDSLTDTIKNKYMGTVVSVETEPYTLVVLNEKTGEYVQAQYGDYLSAVIVVEVPCSISDKDITAESGFAISGQSEVSVSGPGYFGSGHIISIERGDVQ